MTQQHFSLSNKKPALPAKEEEPNSFQLIMADSLEVMEYYYRGKIQEMEQSLSQLNILEHAGKISSICKDIMRTKQLLDKVFLKKNAQYKIHISVK